ncbi:TBC1 domain family member 17 isoform X1 [Rhincodon typus]|uniref:TBC1 domain family member 17 isoform X1 n=1 Tax=Rhincodon typus TaxID=259920 RepID=UPI00202DDD29|nr:TBC1 domain family member 17 isoform X1 [Rhincodon typus]
MWFKMKPATKSHKVVFEKEGVFLHTSTKRNNDQDTLIPGVIRILEKGHDTVMEWTPISESGEHPQFLYSKKDSTVNGASHTEEEMFDPGYEPDWAVISTVGSRTRPLEDMRAATRSSEVNSKWAFSLSLSELKSIRKNKPGLGWSYLIFITKEGISFPALHFHGGGTRALLKCLCKYVVLATSKKDPRLYLIYSHDSHALSQSFDELQLFDEHSSDLVSRFIQDPYAATFGSFSKVTNFLRGALRPQDGSRHRPLREMASGLDLDQQEEPGFEVIMCQADLGQRPAVQRQETITAEEWEKHLDSEGRVQAVEELKKKIFKGGLCHSIRREVWKFLLGYYSWDSTAEERRTVVKQKTDEYFRMKLQWKSVTEDQERRNSQLRAYKSLIERDVSRTDRSNKFYEGNDNPGLVLLNDVLMTYCMYNFDLGYVQGMSDLLSPILYVTLNEVDSFWCFTDFMEQVHRNFEESQESMKEQLEKLALLLRILDSALCDFLDSRESGNLCFCFRWLLIWFKREFSFPDILRLWEVLWTGLPCPNFHLLVCCAILDSERDALMNPNYGFNEILKHINELTMRLNVEDVLCKAEAIYLQLAACPQLQRSVQQILGLVEDATPTASTSSGTGSSPQALSPSQTHESELTDSASHSLPDSSIEILHTEDGAIESGQSP